MSSAAVLVIPVKRWDRAKSRLSADSPRAAAARPDPHVLAEAFARDAIAAALACTAVREVYVVTDQPGWSVPGVQVLPDKGDGDLNVALSYAEQGVRARHPGAVVAAMCADLPCLLPGDLAVAVEEALTRTGERSFVADSEGTGTTFLSAPAGVRLAPHFGPGSASLHAMSRAVPITSPVRTLRRDVDTVADLDSARMLGLGPHTSAVLSD